MQRKRSNNFWALVSAAVITLLLGTVALGLVAVLIGQNNQKATLQVLVTASKYHGQTLKKLDAVLNLKSSSVKAIVNGQNQIIGYLVTNNLYARAICQSVNCHTP